MSERLADVSARIEGIRHLGTVVNAMRGIAGSRVQKARDELKAVDAYSRTIVAGLVQVLALVSAEAPPSPGGTSKAAIVVFGAEQGFAGAFNERVLETIADDVPAPVLFLVGTRGISHAIERGIVAEWTSPMPSHSAGIPKLASDICGALYRRIGTQGVERVTAVFADGSAEAESTIVRRLLLPLDPTTFAGAEHREPPILNLPARKLLADLTAEYLHALFCEIALHAFAAENQARMTAMAAAHREIDRQLGALRATFRHVRQEQITAEIVELAGGAASSEGREGR
ncbi:F0F1 ATP synthase subunit gamma [Aurantimonas marina]|uniref:F0F1 ATP synthase subunit gamma n=1 Tax=Aurantimonas marina TaxID=2780508 RepID=UPI0019D2670D|nr:FoF1 ATP synthase subunit gamma [Aurantimonas marina]